VTAPWRNPAEIAAELFNSCSFQIQGDPIGAADRAAYYLFQELIVRLGVDQKRHRELVDNITNDDRSELDLGINRARRALQRYARPLSRRRLNRLKDVSLLDRLDMMPGGPNIHELARQIARETKTEPTETEIDTIKRRIQKLNAKRKCDPFLPQRQG
jgi:hypothetical protein